MKQAFILISWLALFAETDAPIFQPDDPSKLIYSGTCDAGATQTFQYKWPGGDVIKIVPKSENKYLAGVLPESNLVFAFFFQPADAKDKDPIPLTETEWITKLKEESPNFYKRYKGESNDCVGSPPKDEKKD